MVDFCPTCEKVLKKKKGDEGINLVCPACGYTRPLHDGSDKKTGKAISKKMETMILKSKTLVIDEIDKVKGTMPTVKVTCPKCGHYEAEYEQYQTRSADEPATTFYHCLKCKHKWREY